jgi:hypothetical protein
MPTMTGVSTIQALQTITFDTEENHMMGQDNYDRGAFFDPKVQTVHLLFEQLYCFNKVFQLGINTDPILGRYVF